MEIEKKHFEISKNDLTSECVQQPSLYQFYAEKSSDLKQDLDKLKLRFKQMRAEKELAIRMNPPNGVKLTEAVVNAILDNDSDLGSLEAEIVDKSHDVRTMESAVTAMEQKRSMLNTLVNLANNHSYNMDAPIGGKDSLEYIEEQLTKDLKI